MVYDNTKFHVAFDAWLELNVEIGYGDHYAGDLLDDFCEFCRETKMMKRSPGRVVFGRRMKEKGFERRKAMGLTHWFGLELKKPRIMNPRRQQKTLDEEIEAHEERDIMKRREEFKASPEGRKIFLRKFHEEMEEEERKLRESEDV